MPIWRNVCCAPKVPCAFSESGVAIEEHGRHTTRHDVTPLSPCNRIGMRSVVVVEPLSCVQRDGYNCLYLLRVQNKCIDVLFHVSHRPIHPQNCGNGADKWQHDCNGGRCNMACRVLANGKNTESIMQQCCCKIDGECIKQCRHGKLCKDADWNQKSQCCCNRWEEVGWRKEQWTPHGFEEIDC